MRFSTGLLGIFVLISPDVFVYALGWDLGSYRKIMAFDCSSMMLLIVPWEEHLH